MKAQRSLRSLIQTPRCAFQLPKNRRNHSTSQPLKNGWPKIIHLSALNGVAVLTAAAATATLAYQNFVSPSRNTDVIGTLPKYADKNTMLMVVKLISDRLGKDAISFDEDLILTHGYSEWSTSNCEARPIAIVTPKSTEEVSLIAKLCSKYKVPMVPFGAGSSVEGNFTAPLSGLSIDFSQMDKILEFHEDDMDVVVQPGVNWVDLNEKLRPSALFLPLDPSPTASTVYTVKALIGGMVATNCSGTNAVRYGTMKDWVLNLTVVLADGSIIRTRHRPRKNSAGYNLTSLFIGSEGTLGMVTEITLKLATIPEKYSVATATFNSVKDAANTATKILRQGIPVAAIELMDEVQMAVINKNGGAGNMLWEEKPTLFFKFSGTPRGIEEDISRVKAIASKHGSSQFQFARTEREMHNLWAARKEALWAMLAQREAGSQIWSTDVAVPLSRLAEIIESGELGLFSSVLGHVGDGNFHQAVMYHPDDPLQTQSVKKCVDRMMERAIAMEGTVSGEHGIGLGKKNCLLKELGVETIGIMRTLKKSLDPHYLMNPGKIFDH